MLNRYPWWKYLIIGLVLVIGIIYALPNLFGEDPAVQISPARTGLEIDQPMYARVIDKLESEQLDYKSAAFDAQRLLVRFSDTEVQLKAADILRELLGRDYTVALNLAPSTPEFMRTLGLAPMYLGLDLRGGVHFLMEVDMDA
ncbi:MAG: protein translocase subunit SecD, partial [Candidatus Competibacteraceae bacterium]|nr:protein translocase subunit SecD [Candidatus Competibacteraceae bacterium]